MLRTYIVAVELNDKVVVSVEIDLVLVRKDALFVESPDKVANRQIVWNSPNSSSYINFSALTYDELEVVVFLYSFDELFDLVSDQRLSLT